MLLHVHSSEMGEDDIATFLGQNMAGCQHLASSVGGGAQGHHHANQQPPNPPPLPPPPPGPATAAAQVHVEVPMDMDGKNSVGYLMYQCREARLASQTVQVTSVIREGSGITYKTDTVGHGVVGGRLEDDMHLSKKFHGARMYKVAKQTNECMSSSFDPLNMSCLMCEDEHVLLDPSKPMVLVLTDQCFVGNLSGGVENCIGIVKLENGDLHELVDLAFEILEGKQIPPGSVLMLGAGSYLNRVGASTYAWDWVQCTNRIANKWRTVNVCPLIPRVTGACSGSFHREVGQLAVWLSQVYQGSTRGLSDTWAALIRKLDVRLQGGTLLQHMDEVRIPMPADLEGSATKTYLFRYNSSCPASLSGLDCKATEELVRALILALNKDLSIRLDPETILKREPEQSQDAKHSMKVVVFGASNMSRTVLSIRAAGIEVIDLTVPGWVATATALGLLKEKLTDKQLSGSIFVIEPFSNSTIRFEQVDGTQCLPLKIGSHYHLPGAVSVSTEAVFKKTVDSVVPLLRLVEGPKIIVPPLPRYLSTPCCQCKDHCTNLKDPGYGIGQLDGLTALRDCLKTSLITAGISNVRVLDGIGAMGGVSPPQSRPGNGAFLGNVQGNLSRDGVHLTETGILNMSRAIVATIREFYDKDIASVIFPGSGRRTGTYYWRGFDSPVGSKLRSRTADKGVTKTGHKSGRGRGHRLMPYKRH